MSRKPPNRPGISFEVGAKVEAQDYLKKWYPARIEKLEPENGKLLVHFERWSHRYDEWISWDSSRLRPLERPALRKEGLKDDDHHHHHDKTEFRDGEEVLARWTDCRYYPAKIEAVNKEGMYRVQFYDGVVRSVKRIHIKSMPEDAKGQDWVALVKAATATRSRSFSKPRTSNNSSRLRPDVQGDEDEEEDEDDRETDEDDDTHGGRKRREGEHKDPPTIQVGELKDLPTIQVVNYGWGVSASAGCGSSGSSVKDEPQSDSDSPPFTTDNKHNTGHTDPAPSCSLTCSQRRRSQRLAPTSDAPSDPPTTHLHHEQPCAPQPAAFSQTPGASTEREESSHHNYCTWAPPTTPAQPAMEQSRVTDSPSTNHVVLEEKSPPPIAAAGVRTSSVRTPKNRHAREPILSSLRAPEPPSSSGEEPRQFQCTLPGCSKSFRKAKLLDYHLKYYHSGSPPGLLQNLHHATPSPDRVVRTRATSASLPPVSTAHALELLDSKRRRTVSSSSSLSPQAFHLEDVRSTVRSCGKKKRSSTSVSSDNSAELCCSSSLPPLAPHPCSLALSPPPPPPRELRLEPPHPHPHPHQHPHPHPGLLSNPLQPGLIKMEKRLKMDAKHLSLGRKKDRRDRRDRDPFKLKQKKKKKKKKSKQHCYHNYDGLSLSLLEHSSSSVHHRQHGGNNTAVSLPAPSSSSSSSKHLVCPRAILQVDLSGENLSEGDFPEDSTTESLPYSAEEELELDLEEEDVPLQEDELSEACQEIVRCVCQMDEENGFMIQCEECMCWQHSACMGLLEDSIPDQYICYICRDPPGQRCSAKYRHDRDWLAKGHMFGLSVLSENYSKQNSQRIVSTHQLLADLFSLRHVLHGLTLKMDILQDCHSPSLQLWARSWVNSDEHQPMGGLPDCLHFLDPRLPPLPPLPHGSSPLPQPHPLPQPPPSSSSSSSSDAPLLDTYITSEHSYQKPADPVHSPEGSLHPPGPAGGGDSAGCSAMQQHARQQSTVAVPCPNWVEAGHTPGGPVEPSRTSISPVRLSQAEHQARARTRTCVQWQMNLLTHIEDVQNQLASRMDYIEKELDVLESWLDLSGGLEPPDPLARLPQLKLSIKQLLADLSKLQHISALCSV